MFTRVTGYSLDDKRFRTGRPPVRVFRDRMVIPTFPYAAAVCAGAVGRGRGLCVCMRVCVCVCVWEGGRGGEGLEHSYIHDAYREKA